MINKPPHGSFSVSRKVRSLLQSIGFLPALLLVIILVMIPLYLILRDSFSDGFEHYAWALSNSTNRKVLWITFRTAAITSLVTVLLAYPYAYAMTLVNKYMMYVLFAFVLIPFWTNLTIRSFAWIAILENNGVLNSILQALGGPKLNILGSSTAVTIGMVQILLPFAVLPIYAVMARVGKDYVPAAQGLGASPLRAFIRVYLPLTTTGVISAVVLVFTISLGFYITPALLGSPGDTMIAVLIRIQVGGLLNWGRAGALSGLLLFMTIIILLAGAVAFALLRRKQGGRK